MSSAHYGSADNVGIRRGSGVARGQPVSGTYESYAPAYAGQAHQTTYTGYNSSAIDHENTIAPPKITFGSKTSGTAHFDNHRVSAPPPTTHVNTSYVAPPAIQTSYVAPPAVTTSVVNRVAGPPPPPTTHIVQEAPRYQGPTSSTIVHQQPVVHQQTVVHQEPVAHRETVHTYQEPVAHRETVHTYQEPPVQQYQQSRQYTTTQVEKTDDNFLCSKACWAIAAIIGLILLTLALLWGLGVFGGDGIASGQAPDWDTNLNVDTPVVAAPSVNVDTPVVAAPNVNVQAPTVAAPSVNVQTPSATVPTTSVSPISASVSPISVDSSVAPASATIAPTAATVAPTAATIAPTAASVTPTSVTPTYTVPTTSASVSPQTVAPTATNAVNTATGAVNTATTDAVNTATGAVTDAATNAISGVSPTLVS